jgi:hypothetical protein
LCFPTPPRTDRSCAKLATEVLQEIRSNIAGKLTDRLKCSFIENAQSIKENIEPILLATDDTVKQLLARSRYFFYKTNVGSKIKQTS